MALQHHEFKLRLRDTERLRLYVQSGMVEREMQSASLKEAELACRRLELEAKESAERAARVEAERDTTRHEAAMPELEIEWAINARAQMESELSRVQHALTVAESTCLKAESEREVVQKALSLAREACTKAEEENSRLTDERLSLILELETIKDDFVAFGKRSSLIERRWRPSSMQSATRCSTMTMVAVFLHTTYARANLRSRMECRILQSR